ncbi:MAG: chromate transporter [Hymenobacter sp.]
MRLAVGVIFFTEGIQKFLFLPRWARGASPKSGCPCRSSWGHSVGTFEIGCGLLVLLGLFTRLASGPLLLIMLVSIASTKVELLADKGFWGMLHESRTDWAMLLGSLFLLLKGGGKWSVDERPDRPRNGMLKLEPKKAVLPATSLGELATLFLRLGTTAFGGPAAHVALMEDEVVRRRGWLTQQQFLDLLSAANLIPGPNSTELAIQHWLRAARLEGAAGGRHLLYSAGHAPGHGLCLGLCALRHPAGPHGRALRREARYRGRGGAGALEPGQIGPEHLAAATGGRGSPRAGFAGRERAAAALRGGPGHRRTALAHAGAPASAPGPAQAGWARWRRWRCCRYSWAWGRALRRPGRRPRWGCCRSGWPSLKSARCSTAAATCCWPSSTPTWCSASTGSARASCSTPWWWGR